MVSIDSDPSLITRDLTRDFTSSTQVRFSLGFGLLVLVGLVDIIRPFDRSWSMLYVIPVVYAGWYLRGRSATIFLAFTGVSVFLLPLIFRPDLLWPSGNGLFYRTTGTIAGIFVLALIRERQRLVEHLRELNANLEKKVIDRSMKLSETNTALRKENEERQQAETLLKESQLRLESLSRQLLQTQETERRHLARELHDEIGQVLTAIKMNLRRFESRDTSQIPTILHDNLELADQAILQVRKLSFSLRPIQLDELGLAAALHGMIKHPGMAGQSNFHLQTDLSEERLSPDVEIASFRIAQEAVTNAIRHSRAQNVYITLIEQNGQILLSVRDDGRGFDLNLANKKALNGESFGLSSMKERASLIGGELTITSHIGSGTLVSFTLPMDKVRPSTAAMTTLDFGHDTLSDDDDFE